ncbi:TPA: DUF4355 domain-containing protein [Staphylococcus aureus]|uniref:DUF4355 domain-containing protein n=2 Tax=Staphylococcus aureus TaxID=1280 RepID=A0AAW4Y902_STAAU|nr:DUF4355 domain-containing protein [Staphylococcus aureus]MBE7573826.1 DUF4355 domain-containing protein [Staphylococcus aureus]MBE7576533.1 DUF4355 domain-containing protein [Staphylococcus aureus]MBE7581916.1 DUF4355 domain-containing protein [Staphylococcus aureus]MBE7587641.1 DUF4355 domain-containing protein [Staphylococcus aureus]MBE7590498.1 DUF4355 domain-containing protein [Staphylococcus aureus]
MEENKLKFNLQFFADQPDDPEEPGEDGIKGNLDKKENGEGTEITFTPEQQKKVDEILERRVAHEKKKADEYAKEKAEEAAKLAKMNKDQKAEYEREKLEVELKQLRAEKALNEMRSEARVMFKDKDIDVSDELLDIVVSDSAETTKNNVDNLTKILDEMVQKKVQETLRQNSPKSFSKSGLSRDEILAIKDDSERQNAIAQNMHLFN